MRLRAGFYRELGVLDVEDALEDQLARPDAADPVDVLPVQRGVELRGRPFREFGEVLGAFDVTDDVAEAAALAAQHAGDPGRACWRSRAVSTATIPAAPSCRS